MSAQPRPTCCKTNVVQAVEERQPGRLQGIFPRDMVELPKPMGKGGHGLRCGECLVVEAIVHRGQRDQEASQGQRPIEVLKRSKHGHLNE